MFINTLLTHKRRLSIFLILLVVLSIACRAQAFGKVFHMFSAPAVGGTLGISRNNGPVPPTMAITTEPREPAEGVAQKLAGAINTMEEPFVNMLGMTAAMAEASGNTLKLKTHLITFTFGTETGLGIPRAPLFMTADWDENTEEIQLAWENSEEYDALHMYGPVWGLAVIPGEVSEYILSSTTVKVGESSDYINKYGHLLCRLVANRNGLPSGAVDVEVSPNSMAEVYRVPFSGGVAPSWQRWHDMGLNAPAFRQDTRWECTSIFDQHEVLGPEDAPYYQTIEARGGPVDGGIYRKFLGLKPGRHYRLNMRLNAIKKNGDGESVLTVNALCTPSAVGTLSAMHMSGKTSLPPAPEGAGFTQEIPLQPEESIDWTTLDRINADAGARTVRMPEGCDTLHVWLRLQSNGTHATVGMDWVELSKVEQ